MGPSIHPGRHKPAREHRHLPLTLTLLDDLIAKPFVLGFEHVDCFGVHPVSGYRVPLLAGQRLVNSEEGRSGRAPARKTIVTFFCSLPVTAHIDPLSMSIADPSPPLAVRGQGSNLYPITTIIRSNNCVRGHPVRAAPKVLPRTMPPVLVFFFRISAFGRPTVRDPWAAQIPIGLRDAAR